MVPSAPSAKEHLQEILAALPSKPGVYIYKNDAGDVIYVGKAINLRNRVRSYFHASGDHSPKTRRLVQQIADIEFIVLESELEALLQEMTLIKRHRPKYNIRLKDDKRYPYVKVTLADPFPKVYVTRRMEKDGSRYFGPYTSVWAVHQTLDLLRRIFPYLTCDREITGKDKRACLYHDLGLCMAPCIGAATQARYREMIDGLCLFLEGRTETIVNRLQAEMMQAADRLDFERAAKLRDQIQAIDRVVEKQKVITAADLDQDVIAFARSDGEACAQVFFIRSGKLIGRESFVMEGTEEADSREVMSSFLKQYYSEAAYVPREVLLPDDIGEAQVIETWLKTRRGSQEKVVLRVPKEGQGLDLVQMAAENAAETLSMLKAQWEVDTNKQTTALVELEEALGLPEPPTRIECYDISNTQGLQSVGSMVVFLKGVPRKSDYRRFNIKTVVGPNDFESMREVLTRRFQRWADRQDDSAGEGSTAQATNGSTRAPGKKEDSSFATLPDLLIVDGGKGQLGVAEEVLEHFGLLGRVPLASLAKQKEEIFRPGRSESILLPRHSQALFLVQRIRDEAHRFALKSHRARRAKVGLASQLEEVPGVGPARRRALLQQFGSLDGIREASVEDLLTVPGITRQVAESIKENI